VTSDESESKTHAEERLPPRAVPVLGNLGAMLLRDVTNISLWASFPAPLGGIMARLNVTAAAVCALALAPCLGGCAAVVVGGMAAAGGVGYEAAQERGLNGTFDDAKTKTDIGNALNGQYGNITATAYWGRVLLTGSSPSQQQKLQAEQIVSQMPGVRAVYNEVVVGPPPNPWDSAQDGWITARLKSDLVFDADVRSGNYVIDTDHRSVYLIGSARSQAELDRATELARYVPGVQRVVSYVEIRQGDPNGATPPPMAGPPPPGYIGPSYAGPSSPPPPYAGPSSPPPSNAPIQVQKLP
jgi:osmotically-inducible protein OsmY